MLHLPEFSADRIILRSVVWGAIFCLLVTGYVAYRHYSGKTQPSQELKTGLKALTDPESLVKDL